MSKQLSINLKQDQLRVASGLWTPRQCLYSGFGSLKSAAATIRHGAYQSASMINAVRRKAGFNLRNSVRAFLMSCSEPLSAATLYPLNDRDLSVLETQVQGDLAAFRRRHGIRELVLSEGAVSWRGCGKRTPPCPFNLYVNRLGLNTAPCCRDHMRELSHHVATCLSEMGVVHWLEGGSLLGAVRERGALLDWEDDIDMSVLLDGDMTWERLTAGLTERGARDGYFVDLFEKKDFVSISYDAPKPWPFRWERNRQRGEIRADIAIYRPAISHGEAVLERCSHKSAMPATENGGYGVPRGIVLPTSTVPFLGRDVAFPNRTEAYFRVLYGDFRKIEYTYVDAGPAKARARIDAGGDQLFRKPT